MRNTIVDIDPREMSFIFGDYKGEKWSPVNGDARVLTVKGEPDARTLGEKAKDLVSAFKAYFSDTDAVDQPATTYPVSEDVADNIDNDGDGASDYSAIALAMCYAAADINQAMGLQEPAKSEAIAAVIDKYNAEYAAKFAQKAGKRHSAADMAEINDIALAVQTISTRLASLGYQDPNVEDEPNDNPDGADAPGDGDGDADDVMQVAVTDDRGVGQTKADKDGPYGDVAYADEKNKKYPIDTAEHVRAALSYIGMEKNASKYSADDLKTVKDRIDAAAKKFGIGESDKAHLEDVIKAHVEPLIAAQAAEFQQQIVTAKAEAQSQIDAAKAEADSRASELERKLQAVTQRAESAEATVKAAVADASKPSSPGFVPTMRADGTREDPAAESTKAEVLAQIGKPEKIADVLRLQRLAQS